MKPSEKFLALLDSLDKEQYGSAWTEQLVTVTQGWVIQMKMRTVSDLFADQFRIIEDGREPVDRIVISPFNSSIFRKLGVNLPEDMKSMNYVRKTGKLGTMWGADIIVDDTMPRDQCKLEGRLGTIHLFNIGDHL